MLITSRFAYKPPTSAPAAPSTNAESTAAGGGFGLQLISAYIQELRLRAPGIHVDLAFNLVTGNFGRCFVCPAQSPTSFRQCRLILAAAGTFLNARFVQKLLLAAAIDADGRNLLLASAVVETGLETRGDSLLLPPFLG
ncbi:hypothetical protein MMC16_007693 [Acarospora aff. strigata]|nr:hypothetical protein [Acarospora aff. strigata]